MYLSEASSRQFHKKALYAAECFDGKNNFARSNPFSTVRSIILDIFREWHEGLRQNNKQYLKIMKLQFLERGWIERKISMVFVYNGMKATCLVGKTYSNISIQSLPRRDFCIIYFHERTTHQRTLSLLHKHHLLRQSLQSTSKSGTF